TRGPNGSGQVWLIVSTRFWVNDEAPAGVDMPAGQAAVWISGVVIGLPGLQTGEDGGGRGTHCARDSQQVGAAVDRQEKVHDCPGGVVPVAGAKGAGPHAGPGGGVAIGVHASWGVQQPSIAG